MDSRLVTRSASSTTNSEEESLFPTQQQHYCSPVTTFTEEEQMVQESVRTWSREILQPKVRDMEKNEKICPDVIKDLFDYGLMGIEIPEEYGGSNMNFTSAILVVEELSRIDPSVAILVDIHNTLTNNAIRFWGSPDLQAKWLPKLATNSISSFCLSEAGSGSDAFSMKTTAKPIPGTKTNDDEEFIINGSKLWISNAREADAFLVFANVDLDKGYKGITAFILDREMYKEDGNGENGRIIVGKPESKLGLKASATSPVIFDNVKVSMKEHLLGEVGMGYKYCINILNEGRVGIAAQQVGIAKGCLDVVMPYLNERKQFGQTIGSFQGMQHQYAQIATEIHAAEVMLYNACRLKEKGLPFIKEASMAKLYSSQIAEKTASKSIEWLGGIGFTTDMMVEKFYRDCKVGSIYEGTSNIQLQTIAKIVQQADY